MTSAEALKILCALADGVDPVTGEVLPEDSVFQRPDVIRALFVAMRAVEEQASAAPMPTGSARSNAGKPWSPADDLQLRERFLAGVRLRDLAAQFGRTRGAIRARLERLGLIPPTRDHRSPDAPDAEGAGG